MFTCNCLFVFTFRCTWKLTGTIAFCVSIRNLSISHDITSTALLGIGHTPFCCVVPRYELGAEKNLMSQTLSIYLSIYPIYISIYTSIYLFTSLCIYLYIYLSIYMSMYLSIHLSIYLHVYVSIYLSIHLYTSIYLSIHLYTSIYLSIHLYIYLVTYGKCFVIQFIKTN